MHWLWWETFHWQNRSVHSSVHLLSQPPTPPSPKKGDAFLLSWSNCCHSFISSVSHSDRRWIVPVYEWLIPFISHSQFFLRRDVSRWHSHSLLPFFSLFFSYKQVHISDFFLPSFLPSLIRFLYFSFTGANDGVWFLPSILPSLIRSLYLSFTGAEDGVRPAGWAGVGRVGGVEGRR